MNHSRRPATVSSFPLFFLACFLSVTVPAILPVAAAAWGGIGHRISAHIAYECLTPSAKTAVKNLLASETLVDVAKWADDVRPQRPETKPYHFIEMPPFSDNNPVPELPGGESVVTALHLYKAQLGDPSLDRQTRSEALKFFIHFIGDVNQPMHCVPAGDFSGNDVKLTFMGQPSNLHKVWDSGLIYQTGISEEAYAKALLTGATPEILAEAERGTFSDWAWKSYQTARFHAYALPHDLILTERYLQDNLRIMNRHLLLSGLRIGAELNAIFAVETMPVYCTTGEIPVPQSIGF
jgi:hypothetical protein